MTEKRIIEGRHFTDGAGRPAGGITQAQGFTIAWQVGPINEFGNGRNGAFVEEVIDAALDRLRHYQESVFACDENAAAMEALEEALGWLNRRTGRRIAEGVEGTHEGS